MGVILLLAGVRQSYAHGTADSELIKQYEFMAGIFYNARRRLDSATDPAERRQVLQALGDAALEEHAEMISREVLSVTFEAIEAIDVTSRHDEMKLAGAIVRYSIELAD
jgi:hypothetical protein